MSEFRPSITSVLAILVAGAVLSSGAAAAPPLSAFGSTPAVTSPSLSPDGANFAFISGGDGAEQIQIRRLSDNALINVSAAGERKVRDLQWAGSEHLLLTASYTMDLPGTLGPRREWSVMSEFDLGNRKWKTLLNNLPGTINVVTGSPTALDISDKSVLIAPGLSLSGGFYFSTLIRVDLQGGYTRSSEIGNKDTVDWTVGDEGKAVARVDYAQKEGEWRLFLRSNDQLRQAYVEQARLDEPSVLGLAGDGKALIIASHKSGEWKRYQVTIATGAWSAPLEQLDDGGLIQDPASRRVIGTRVFGLDGVTYTFENEADQRVWNAISKAFPGELVTLTAWSADRMTIIVEVEGKTNGDAFFIVDRKGKTASPLTNRYSGIKPADLGPVRTLTYKAADGTEIPAYLTLPPNAGASPKKLPLIVLVHGGPASRDYPGFDWWAQALASRGYAVLQPQFRGSKGFGVAHEEAGYGQWGRKMQTDLSDGVRFLAKEGTIDPARVCIVGGSYGGYAALAGVTLDPGVYRCASAVAGVSDLRRMLVSESLEAGSSQNSTLRYWQRFMGAADKGDKSIDAWSPARLAAKVNVPVQLIHGKDDTVVLYEQSKLMEKALRDAGKQVEFVTLPNEDHWLSRSATRIQMLEAQVAFVERNNPVSSPATVAAVGR